MTKEELQIEADKALNAGKVEDAIIYFETMLELNNNDIDAMLSLSKMYSDSGNNKKALYYCEKAYELDPNRQEISFKRGYILHTLNSFEEAVKNYKESIEKEEVLYYSHLNMGLAYMSLEKKEEAKKAIKGAIEIDPNNNIGYYDLAILYEKESDYAKAEALYETLIVSNPKNVENYIRKGEFFLKQQEYDKAIDVYNKALIENPNVSYLYILKGNVEKSRKEIEKAIEEYKMAMNIDPENAYNYDRLYELYEEERRTEDIEALIKQCAATPNMQEKALNMEGTFASWQGDFLRAKKVCEKLLDMDQKDEATRFNYSYVLEQLRKYDEALEELEKIPKTNSNEFRYYDTKVRILMTSGEYKEALEELEKKYNNKSDELTGEEKIYYLEDKAMIYREEKDYEKSNEAYSELLKSTDNSSYLKNTNIQMGLNYYFDKKYNDALICYDVALSYEKENTKQIDYYRGLTFLEDKRYNEAIETFDSIIEKDENNINAYLKKAEALVEKKSFDEAINIYEFLINEKKQTTYYQELQETLKKAGRYKEALDVLNTAEEEYSEDYNVYLDKADICLKSKENEEAFTNIEKAYNLNSDEERVQELFIKILKKLGRKNEATFYEEKFNKED